MRATAGQILPLALVALSLGLAFPARAQTVREAKICENTASSPEDIIRTCSVFIRTKRFTNGKPLPNNIIAMNYIRRGNAYARLYDFDRAIPDYNAAVEISPTPADALSSRGFTYLTAGDDEHALADFEASLRINAKQAFSLQGRGSIYLRRFDYERALADFNSSIESNPKLAWTYYYRSTLFYIKGETGRGDADIKKAVQLEPTSRNNFEENANFTRNWLQYLKEIQDDRDYANWARPPLDAYIGPH